jgi:glycerophosphoryl diester phosphodiesterase
VGIISVVFIGIAGPALGSPWRSDRPITVGHRGTRVLADENTMAAFAAAYENGLDMFEVDPRMTRDGVYVIMHDPTVDRTTNGHGKVADLTLSQIEELRTASGQEVPTLQQALAFAKSHHMGVYLDMKVPPPDGAALLVKLVEDAGMTDDVIVGCWHNSTCRMVERRKPEISTCISWPWPMLTLEQAKASGADAVGTLKGLASKPMIRHAHRLGLRVITMPIIGAENLEKFDRRGLDALQADDPRILEPYGKRTNQ